MFARGHEQHRRSVPATRKFPGAILRPDWVKFACSSACSCCLGGGFKHVLFSSLFGEDFQFD